MSKKITHLVIKSPYTEPSQHWKFVEEEKPLAFAGGRRQAGYMAADPAARPYRDRGIFVPLPLLNQIRQRVDTWRETGYPGVTGITKTLLEHWKDPEQREFPFFFCRIEAIETLIWFLESHDSEKTGISIPDDGSVSGIQKKNFQEWLMDTVVGRYVHPSILPDYEEVSFEDKRIAIVKIPQGSSKPYARRDNDREDIYVRYGNTCQLATREQQARLFEAGGLLSAEKFPVHGSTIADLDERRYKKYFYQVLQYPMTDDLQKLLVDHSFLVGESPNLSCSYFAYALFAKAPKPGLPQAGLRLTVYEGGDKDYNTLFDKDFDIPLVEYRGSRTANLIETALHENIHFREYVSREELKHMTRKRVWDYPQEVIRELVINALIHRDWTKQDYVRVVIYANRFEITSPGALPNGMTVERIKSGVSVQRNPLSARIFRDYGYLEQQGMGIRRKVIPLMLKHNGREPDFESTEDHFKVTLWKA